MALKAQLSPIRILLAEDFHADTELILRELRDAEMMFDHRVSRSEDEFGKHVAVFHPDVILSPYSLRETNALELLKMLRERDVHSPFILLAFDLSEDIAIELLSEGVEDYITRSTIKRVPVSIRKALQRYKTELELRISESLYKEAQQIAKLGSWYMDSPTAELQWSDEMYTVHGMRRGAIDVGKVRNLTLPEDREMFDALTQRLFDGEDTSMVYRIRVPDTNDVKYLLANGKVNKDHFGEIVSLSGTVQDVSDRIVTQLELERIQNSLIEAQKIAKVGSWEWDVGAENIWWSEEMYRVYDISSDTVPTIGLVRSFVHPDDKKRVEKLTSTDLDEGFVPVFEYRIQLRSGIVKHVISSAKQVLDDKGKVIRLIGTLQDVTERQMMKQTLRQNEELLREMAEHIEDVFWITSASGEELIYMSPQYEKVYGRSLDEIYQDGDAWARNIHPEERARLLRSFKENGAVGKYNEEYRLVYADGSIRWVHARAFPIKNEEGVTVRLAGVTTDITDRKKREEEIQMLSLVASETINGVLIQDATGKIAWSNKGFSRISGFSAEEVLGRRPWAILSGEKTNMKLAEMTHAKIKEGRSFSTDNIIYTRSGEPVWVTVAVSPILDENGNLTKMVTVATDISKQKELEQLQRTTLERLRMADESQKN